VFIVTANFRGEADDEINVTKGDMVTTTTTTTTTTTLYFTHRNNQHFHFYIDSCDEHDEYARVWQQSDAARSSRLGAETDRYVLFLSTMNVVVVVIIISIISIISIIIIVVVVFDCIL
jgi:mevalonate pyrophosphate decarboxylase